MDKDMTLEWAEDARADLEKEQARLDMEAMRRAEEKAKALCAAWDARDAVPQVVACENRWRYAQEAA